MRQTSDPLIEETRRLMNAVRQSIGMASAEAHRSAALIAESRRLINIANRDPSLAALLLKIISAP
jgi:hypothetical protein